MDTHAEGIVPDRIFLGLGERSFWVGAGNGFDLGESASPGAQAGAAANFWSRTWTRCSRLAGCGYSSVRVRYGWTLTVGGSLTGGFLRSMIRRMREPAFFVAASRGAGRICG